MASLTDPAIKSNDSEKLGKLDKAARKLARKQAKKAAKLQQKLGGSGTSTSEDTAVEVPAAATGGAAEQAAKVDSSTAKKLSKAEKRAAKEGKKREREQADAAAHKEQEPKAKKAKAPKPAAPAAPAGRQLASVGDAALAAQGAPIVRDLYSEHPEVAALSEQRLAELAAERRTAVEGAPSRIRPVLAFEHTGLPAAMLHATRDFSAPSPIQSQCWPVILSGHDMVGIAATGSGKTLGFGLPMLAHIDAQRAAGVVAGKGPFAVVLAPTRELAIQIAAVLEDAGSKCGVSCVCVYGGVPKGPQVGALRKGVDIVVATPGRLEDLMNDGVCKLRSVTYLVLDEADRMLDLGFEPHIRAICGTIRSDRQTLMFSATWPTAVQQLAANYMSAPVKVTIGSADLAASHSVAQTVEVLDQAARDERLLQLMAKHTAGSGGGKGKGGGCDRAIIFVLYKKEAPRVEALLTRRGYSAAAIHGDISQAQRSAAVDAFKAGSTPLLVATDVAARGLDIPDVELVVNYSFPLTIEDYVHRIGRTGRAGKTGRAHTFFCASSDKPRAGELINVLREAGQAVPDALLAFGTTVKKKEHKLYGAHFKDVDLSKKASKITFDD